MIRDWIRDALGINARVDLRLARASLASMTECAAEALAREKANAEKVCELANTLSNVLERVAETRGAFSVDLQTGDNYSFVRYVAPTYVCDATPLALPEAEFQGWRAAIRDDIAWRMDAEILRARRQFEAWAASRRQPIGSKTKERGANSPGDHHPKDGPSDA